MVHTDLIFQDLPQLDCKFVEEYDAVNLSTDTYLIFVLVKKYLFPKILFFY